VVDAALPDAVRTDLLGADRREEPRQPGGLAAGRQEGQGHRHPFGTAMGHSGDANVTRSRSSGPTRSYVSKDGKTITINSKEPNLTL